MELHDIEKVLEFVEAIKDSMSPTLSAGSALKLLYELKLMADPSELPQMLAQIGLRDVAGRKVSYDDAHEAVVRAMKIIVDLENGDKINKALS